MKRCPWKNLETSHLYLEYHDHEWGVPSYEDGYLFEMFVLESFQCGLSWLLILKKREAFRKAFDGFDAKKIALYEEDKIAELMENKDIVRNRGKIIATIKNAKAFLGVVEEFGSFSDYLWSFSDHKVVYIPFDGHTVKSILSQRIARDLRKRGFHYMGAVTCHSYLEAVGVQNDHSVDCFLHRVPRT